MTTIMEFNNRKVLITGGTRGIGLDIAKLFIENGANVIITGTLNYVNLEKLIGNNFENCDYIKADFSDNYGINDFVDIILKKGNIDIIINNAGINKLSRVSEINEGELESIFNVNLFAPIILTSALLKNNKINSFGRIINISSIWSVKTKVSRGLYSSTKSGLIGFTKTLAIELAKLNITVNAISPGFTDTELTRRILTEFEITQITESVPMARLASPIEIAEVVLFIASKRASYITGQNIIVDGGFSCV